MSKFKTLKVFDCQSMPAAVRQNFFSHWSRQQGNDCYVSYYNEDVDEIFEDEDEQLFVKWLKENGMEPSDELVLIRHWW